MSARETVERYMVEEWCDECGGGPIEVRRGGGVISVACASCSFSASCDEEDVNAEVTQFMEEVARLTPEDRMPYLIGGTLGIMKAIAFFILAFFAASASPGK